MKWTITLMFALMMAMTSAAQQPKYTGNDHNIVLLRDQPQDSTLVISVIPTIGTNVSYLAGYGAVSLEAQLWRRWVIAPSAQADLLGRWNAYGFYSSFFFATSRNFKLGIGYQGMSLNIINDKFISDDGEWLHRAFLDARIQRNDRWDWRFTAGVGSAGGSFEAGMVYRLYD